MLSETPVSLGTAADLVIGTSTITLPTRLLLENYKIITSGGTKYTTPTTGSESAGSGISVTGVVASSNKPNVLLPGPKGIEGTGSSVGSTGSTEGNTATPMSTPASTPAEVAGASSAASSAEAKSEMGRMKPSWLLSLLGTILGSLLIGFWNGFSC